MTETPTLSDRRGLAQAAVAAASTKLAELANERASLGLAVYAPNNARPFAFPEAGTGWLV
jgi:hypothetical protein